MNNSREVSSRFAEAVGRLDGDESLFREMAAITSADLPEVIDETQRALDDCDGDAATAGLHKLKGMLSTFETGGVTLEIQEILDMTRRQEVTEAKSKFQRHKSELDELVGEITSIALD